MGLRPYQKEALHAIRESYRRGKRSVLCVLPTGTGKTVLFAEISRLAKGPVLVLAHRQELVEQARDKVSAWCDDVVAVEMADRRELTRAPGATGRSPRITVASIQTLSRRLAEVPRDAFRMVIIDEAHHGTADSYRKVIDHFHAHVLGVTATPDRADRQCLGDVFEELAYEYDMRSAIREGFLCPVRSFLVQTRADFSGIRRVAGELATGDVERVLTQAPHLAEIAQPILRERGGRPTIVFAVSVAHAHALARVMCELAGDPSFARALDGSTDLGTRGDTVERFRRGKIQALVNCALFTEGFDVPRIALVAIARPVLSRSFYAQMVGRGTRIAPGKKDLVVLDFVPGNCRHRLVQSIDIFARDEEEVIEEAKQIAAKKSEEGTALAVEEALELARQVVEARKSSVEYLLTQRDPFAAIGFDIEARTARGRGPRKTQGPGSRPLGAELRKYLERAGVSEEQLDGLDERQGHGLREHLLDRKACGLCTPKQARVLCAYGIDPESMYADEAKRILSYIKRHGDESPEAVRQAVANGAADLHEDVPAG